MSDRRTRRRGAALEGALLSAAWDVVMESGYERLTMEAVAERAQTSRPVIARRWGSRQELFTAAVLHWSARNRLPVPDTGSLRGDLLAFLASKSEQRAEVMAVLEARFAALAAENQQAAQQVRSRVERVLSADEIWDRAVDRGQADPAVLTPRIRALPLLLVGSELIQTRRPLPRETIEEILDTIVMPLVDPNFRH
ncbi:TetR/AcrR family transcriptional regulator [Streptomyces sp. OUCMDZ-4982]|uniref:TetR/AcrR family transcriptional regulator n=1 Tax=Streptomyces sp. OUCMDZ-4982 TaxID=2973090 RepID=UPI00215D3FC0|nr:TetR/AcrR family transcriptional regulator [Streptomyces sp. OUCMDZ-4982]MCR8945139.1 TetR/AcrR family transcriptional regulator [Streptomyces sp. OUCMDZ-4982]